MRRLWPCWVSASLAAGAKSWSDKTSFINLQESVEISIISLWQLYERFSLARSIAFPCLSLPPSLSLYVCVCERGINTATQWVTCPQVKTAAEEEQARNDRVPWDGRVMQAITDLCCTLFSRTCSEFSTRFKCSSCVCAAGGVLVHTLTILMIRSQ
jgi:hypothetical protein